MHIILFLILMAELSPKVCISFELWNNSQTIRPYKVIYAHASQSRSYLVISDAIVAQRSSNTAAAEYLEKRALLVFEELWLDCSTCGPLSDFILWQFTDAMQRLCAICRGCYLLVVVWDERFTFIVIKCGGVTTYLGGRIVGSICRIVSTYPIVIIFTFWPYELIRTNLFRTSLRDADWAHLFISFGE